MAVEGAVEASAPRRSPRRSPRSGSSPGRPSFSSAAEPGRRIGGRRGELLGERRRARRVEGVRRNPRRRAAAAPPGGRTSRSRPPAGPRAARICRDASRSSAGYEPPSNLQAWREDRRGSCSWTMNRPCRRFSPTRSARKVMRWWGPWMGRKPWIASVRSGSISWSSTSCFPKLDGIEVCRRLRTRSQVPIIMLTAKGDEIDKVAGLEMGADDYITKPFSVREFRSRVKAALRRGNMAGPAPDRRTSRSRPVTSRSTSSAARCSCAASRCS